MQSPVASDVLDGFFSSPLFGAALPLQGVPSGMLDEPDAELHFDPELTLSLLPAHQTQKETMLLNDPFASPEPATTGSMFAAHQQPALQQQQQAMEWHAQQVQMQLQLQQQAQSLSPALSQHSGYASSRSSSAGSSAGSGHSTPTLMALPSPVQLHQQPETAAAAAASVASGSAPSTPSLLDQLSCTILDGGDDKAAAAAAIKAKKERKTAKKALSTAHLALPVGADGVHSSKPYASVCGYSSGSEPRSPQVGASSSGAASPSLLEDNEPRAGDDEETRKAKLARKAELARLSRKRKKTRLTDLEAEVRRLEDELARAKRSKSEAEMHSNQLNALALAEQEQAQADLVAKHKFAEVIAAMTHAVHSGVVSKQEQEQLRQAQLSSRPSLTGSDASNVSAKPTPLTPLIDAFMMQYGAHANNCMQHLQALAEHHVKPLRTFDFLQTLMQQQQQAQESSSSWSSLLCSELSLGASSREVGELSCFRTSLASQHAFDGDIARALTKLRVLFAKRATQQTKNLSRIRAIFSEAQFAKFVEWAHRQTPMDQQQHAAAAAAAAMPAADNEPIAIKIE